MTIISKNSICLFHFNLNTRFHACKTYSNKTFFVKDICRLYHCSKASEFTLNPTAIIICKL